MTYPLELHQVSAHGLVPYIKQLGNNLVGCELGVCRAHNLIYLLDRAEEVKMTYAIDPYTPYIDEPWGLISQEEINGWRDTAFDILKDCGDRVKFLQMTSAEAVNHIPDNSLDYIFIDGDHNYQPVLDDCRAYWSKVKPGGIFAGHDWILDNVKRAVGEFRQERNITTEIKFTASEVWFWHKE
jgi:hypothetical protein